VGYEEGGYLTEAVRRRPYAVILFDEIEKAHPDVFNILLQILDDGRLTDGKGRTVDFKNTVIIMTSNIGSHAISEYSGEIESATPKLMEALRSTFRPEFLNRIDEVIVFHPLTSEQIRRIVELQIKRLEEQLAQILDGHFVEDERFQLHCQVDRDNITIAESDAFNDVIVQKWNFAKLIELETYVDSKLVHTQRSDGLIVASPTGSTAYALSGGGPILHPSLNALVLVPICPHTLSNRPLVIDGDSVVEIIVGTPEINHASLTCDGDITGRLTTGDRVIVRKKDKQLRLIHPANHDHFAILRAKLHWG
jgi:hypothetical protein